VPPGGRSLRQAAQVVLDAWEDKADSGALAGPMERLRAMLAKPARAAWRGRRARQAARGH
jgi:hypothetical protein